MKQSFQDGVNTIYNKIVSLGVTPSGNSPTDIVNAMQSFSDKQWADAVNSVISNPNPHGLYNQSQYDQNYTNGYNAGKTATKQVSVRTFISSHAWQCYAITYINDKQVCRVDSTNPSDDSTITKSNTATANV